MWFGVWFDWMIEFDEFGYCVLCGGGDDDVGDGIVWCMCLMLMLLLFGMVDVELVLNGV